MAHEQPVKNINTCLREQFGLSDRVHLSFVCVGGSSVEGTRSLCTQASAREDRNVQHTDLSLQQKGMCTVFQLESWHRM